MRKALLALAVAGSLVSTTAPAHAAGGTEIFAFGANSGSVGFTVAAWSTDPLLDRNHHQITHYCNFFITGIGNTIVITIVANATAGPHVVAVSTGIYCEVRDRNGAVAHSAGTSLPGVDAAIVLPSGILTNNGPYTVCSQGTGQWNDTPNPSHLYATSMRCQDPNLPVLPVDVDRLVDLPPL